MKNLQNLNLLQIFGIVAGVLLLNKMLKAKVGVVFKEEPPVKPILPVATLPIEPLPTTDTVKVEPSIPVVNVETFDVESPINTREDGSDYGGSPGTVINNYMTQIPSIVGYFDN